MSPLFYVRSFEQPADGAEADAASTAEKPSKAPASLYSKNEAPVQLVLCIDTMGQVRACESTMVMMFIRSTGLGRTSSSTYDRVRYRPPLMFLFGRPVHFVYLPQIPISYCTLLLFFHSHITPLAFDSCYKLQYKMRRR